MTTRMIASGSAEESRPLAMVGDKNKTPVSLARRMPSAELAAKVGGIGSDQIRSRRVVRRNARG